MRTGARTHARGRGKTTSPGQAATGGQCGRRSLAIILTDVAILATPQAPWRRSWPPRRRRWRTRSRPSSRRRRSTRPRGRRSRLTRPRTRTRRRSWPRKTLRHRRGSKRPWRRARRSRRRGLSTRTQIGGDWLVGCGWGANVSLHRAGCSCGSTNRAVSTWHQSPTALNYAVYAIIYPWVACRSQRRRSRRRG